MMIIMEKLLRYMKLNKIIKCNVCGKITMAELDIKTGKYLCLECLNKNNNGGK